MRPYHAGLLGVDQAFARAGRSVPVVLTVSIETGPNAGRQSPVVWIARRHSEWRRIKGTEGADQYVGENP